MQVDSGRADHASTWEFCFYVSYASDQDDAQNSI